MKNLRTCLDPFACHTHFSKLDAYFKECTKNLWKSWYFQSFKWYGSHSSIYKNERVIVFFFLSSSLEKTLWIGFKKELSKKTPLQSVATNTHPLTIRLIKSGVFVYKCAYFILSKTSAYPVAFVSLALIRNSMTNHKTS